MMARTFYYRDNKDPAVTLSAQGWILTITNRFGWTIKRNKSFVLFTSSPPLSLEYGDHQESVSSPEDT